jgi:hypothetical protein
MLHCHMAEGRTTTTVERILNYAVEHEGVFFTRKCDIARVGAGQSAAFRTDGQRAKRPNRLTRRTRLP